ncbi:MAG: carbon-nitrogen hydrolase family protein [Bacteroidales bacterium]|nr:carbon-nitrogen hydrolase family protein [Bacteroidales bacterium]
MDCAFMQKDANVVKAVTYVRQAADHGAKLVCLPEGFNTGYLGSDVPGMMSLAEPLDGPTITKMSQLAKELGVFLLAPIFCKFQNGVENTAVLIDDEGKIAGTYSKTHPVGDERTYLSRGRSYPVWETKLGKIGCVICYDVCFPETVRLLAIRGAELVLVPAAWRASYYYKDWWDLNLACRALDNLVYVAAVNRTGPSGSEIFAGKSQLCSPIGEVLNSLGVTEEGILYGTVDIARVEKEREFNTVLSDRHTEDYLPLAQL